VLVIDDHPANLQLMAQQLGYLGLEHASARDGRKAWPPGAKAISTCWCSTATCRT
jgi:two-component system sensor histidine kinase EvgS